jgi:KRAB domain-containing zinc finger protein
VKAIHKNLEEPKKNIKKNHLCNICGKAFVSQFKVRRHMVVHSNELSTGLQKNWTKSCYICELCNKKFHTQATIKRHLLICQLIQKSFIERPPEYEYFCVICSQAFGVHDEMVEHMKTHEQTTHPCVVCPDVSYPLNDMIRHGKNHPENITYRCCLCEKTFPNGEFQLNSWYKK